VIASAAACDTVVFSRSGNSGGLMGVGGIDNNGGTLTVTNSTFSGNSGDTAQGIFQQLGYDHAGQYHPGQVVNRQ
jgi:hypothetical protein